jgi:hypothetical protein
MESDIAGRALPAHGEGTHARRAAHADEARTTLMAELFGAGLHAAAGRPVDTSAYEHYICAKEASDRSPTTGRQQAYRALPESSHRAVREEVQARLAEFESGGRIVMKIEMLIGRGRA